MYRFRDLRRSRSTLPSKTTLAGRRTYDAPALLPLGSIEAVTAGPREGNIDQIFGASGGFQDPPDTTS